MKYTIVIFLFIMAALVGCNRSSTVDNIHTHEDGSTHMHNESEVHSNQEYFEVTPDSLTGETDSTEAPSHKHDHGDHSHTH
ncbi:MAG: hypothetical protein K0B15_01080 [Lentimicrobium sp.]|nr:hypothetical protein [Lentimicrobium sp.]